MKEKRVAGSEYSLGRVRVRVGALPVEYSVQWRRDDKADKANKANKAEFDSRDGGLYFSSAFVFKAGGGGGLEGGWMEV